MNTKRFGPDDVVPAAEIIRGGGLLGIPTETVYGLGANGLDPEAVANIFAAKGRPQDNPLILHIPSAAWLERYCRNISDAAYALADRFWTRWGCAVRPIRYAEPFSPRRICR